MAKNINQETLHTIYLLKTWSSEYKRMQNRKEKKENIARHSASKKVDT
jgi:hypothetical protein